MYAACCRRASAALAAARATAVPPARAAASAAAPTRWAWDAGASGGRWADHERRSKWWAASLFETLLQRPRTAMSGIGLECMQLVLIAVSAPRVHVLSRPCLPLFATLHRPVLRARSTPSSAVASAAAVRPSKRAVPPRLGALRRCRAPALNSATVLCKNWAKGAANPLS